MATLAEIEKYLIPEKELGEYRKKLAERLGIEYDPEDFKHSNAGDFSDHGTFTEFMGLLHEDKSKVTEEDKRWRRHVAATRDLQLIAKDLKPKWIEKYKSEWVE